MGRDEQIVSRGIGRRAGCGVTDGKDEMGVGGCEVSPDLGHEGAEPGLMLLALVALFARCIDILEIHDRHRGSRDERFRACGSSARRCQAKRDERYPNYCMTHVDSPPGEIIRMHPASQRPQGVGPARDRANCPTPETMLPRMGAFELD